jgi:hypothetical protein
MMERLFEAYIEKTYEVRFDEWASYQDMEEYMDAYNIWATMYIRERKLKRVLKIKKNYGRKIERSN